ncbi:MAG: sigma factor-like helix-turn-helix DNA-binding protein [Peptoniphilus grossensis]|uniref:sigma factor-like helix-turn-helix DNA-binding protein n=1 Tax=Anaerococcus vaginalis TaxID=33037 RepID=UPI002909A65E|nr:sigma factor-like helix-turn-helix DNA-binding protein [Anaerococcus vaginalis]MDU6181227.1 sigma factor-like helix-turn-helix DNA-binding protein [Anaerococcus vaginalis]
MKKEFYLYVNGQKVKVSEQIYKVYWREKEHEKYLEQVDKKNHLLFFSSLDHDGHFVDNIVDESIDIEKVVEAQMMIEALRSAISKLNAEEKELIERLYFYDETLSSVAKDKGVTYQTIQWRKDRILRKLKEILEKLF